MVSDDLERRRELGLRLQANLPKPRRGRRERPRLDMAGDTAEAGCVAAELGPIGLVFGGAAAIAWLVRRWAGRAPQRRSIGRHRERRTLSDLAPRLRRWATRPWRKRHI